ncbi:mechanosensitive ion channel family protein [Allostreptomyces psammosilenae]|uniref:Uncharacterized protein n=1 Tax=Allostreptomyces psammosilenae TaxID=1892865 RepID=A0A852ZRR5_9ACTN|nr:hypothetical protein [Allostreptomyces psammosilenae]NYI05049.1 hypothetical protein [Allostreptomyces psammosilenae]
MSDTTTLAIDIEGGISNAWNSVAAFVPRLIACLAVLVIGWIIAKVVAKVVDKVLERVGFDRAVERGGIARAMRNSKYDASDLVAKLFYYAVLLITLQVAFSVFGPNPISTMLAGVVSWLPKAAVAIVIVVIAAAIAAGVKDLITGALGGLSYGRALATAAAVFIVGLGLIAALNQIGVAVTVTVPVLITVLATIGGILVVGVGGGLVRPMQQRWERWLTAAEEQGPQAQSQLAAYQRGRRDAQGRVTAPGETTQAGAPGAAGTTTGASGATGTTATGPDRTTGGR